MRVDRRARDLRTVDVEPTPHAASANDGVLANAAEAASAECRLKITDNGLVDADRLEFVRIERLPNAARSCMFDWQGNSLSTLFNDIRQKYGLRVRHIF